MHLSVFRSSTKRLNNVGMKTMMKQRSVLEFHILSGEASREVLSRGDDQRRVTGSQLWTRDEKVVIAVETSSVS